MSNKACKNKHYEYPNTPKFECKKCAKTALKKSLLCKPLKTEDNQ